MSISSGSESVQVIERVGRILDCFSVDSPRLRAVDITEQTGLPASTVARLLRTLVDGNLLQRQGAFYTVGLRVTAWSAAASAGSDLVALAGPSLGHLRDQVGESCGLYVRQGATRVSVLQVESNKSIIYRGYVGQVMPLNAGAAGKVFMAFDERARRAVVAEGLTSFTSYTVTDEVLLDEQLEETRRRGWAFSAEERELGLNSLAAPVYDASGAVVAAIAVGGPSFRLTRAQAKAASRPLLECAQALSRGAAWVPA